MLNKMAGKKRERQIVEMKSLFFLQVRLRRAEEGHLRWILHEITSLTSFELGLPFIIAHSERNVTVFRPVRTCRRLKGNTGWWVMFATPIQSQGSRKQSISQYVVIFSRKHDSQCATTATDLPVFHPATFSSFSNTEHRTQK